MTRRLHVVGLMALIAMSSAIPSAYCQNAPPFPSLQDRFDNGFPLLGDPRVHVWNQTDILGNGGTVTFEPNGIPGPRVLLNQMRIQSNVHNGARGFDCGPVFLYCGAPDFQIRVMDANPGLIPPIPLDYSWVGVDFEAVVAAAIPVVGVGQCVSHEFVQLLKPAGVAGFSFDSEKSPYYANQQFTADRINGAVRLQHLHDMPGGILPDPYNLTQAQWDAAVAGGRTPVIRASFQDWIICTRPIPQRPCVCGHLDFDVEASITPRTLHLPRGVRLRVFRVDGKCSKATWTHEGRTPAFDAILNARRGVLAANVDAASVAAVAQIDAILLDPACP